MMGFSSSPAPRRAAIAMALCSAASSIAQTPIIFEDALITPSSTQFNDLTGAAVAVDSDWAVFGMPRAGDNGSFSGAAVVGRLAGGTWTESARLVPSDGGSHANFGAAVAVSGDTVVVGADFASHNGSPTGAAYVFTFDGTAWTEQAKLTPWDMTTQADFGGAVAIDGDWIAVGAMFSNDGTTFSGAVYVFRRVSNAWVQHRKIVPLDAATTISFGSSVSLAGNLLAIGAPDVSFGRAYVYERNSANHWLERARLTLTDGHFNDKFGTSVSITAEALAVGAPWYGDDDSGRVAVYRLDQGAWVSDGVVTDPAAAPEANFGAAVAISNDALFVGAPQALTATSPLPGRLHGYERTEAGWQETARFLPVQGSNRDYFGEAVAIDGDALVVGAPSANTATDTDTGAGYLFRLVNRAGAPQKLLATGGGPEEWFGLSIAVDGARAAIGASGRPFGGFDDVGSVFLFESQGGQWVQTGEVLPAVPRADEGFGRACELKDDLLVVSSLGPELNGEEPGHVHVFRLAGQTWAHEQTVTSPDATPFDLFGFDVALGDGFIVTGADETLGGGAAYVFRSTAQGWVQEARLISPEPRSLGHFGKAVAAEGDRLVVTAWAEWPDEVILAGAAYVYRFVGGQWVLEQRLSASDRESVDYFGWSVDMDDGMIAIGAMVADGAANSSGAVYLFQLQGDAWVEVEKIVAPDGAGSDWFGWSLDLDGNRLAVSAFQDDDNGAQSGSVYHFVSDDRLDWRLAEKLVPNEPVNENGFPTAVAIADGQVMVGSIEDGANGPEAGAVYIFDVGAPAQPCACEFTGDAAPAVNVFDLLAYLDLWFAGDAAAEMDAAPGVDVFDLLTFLDCWFPASAGQPCD